MKPAWEIPYIDRRDEDLDLSQLDDEQKDFRKNGFIVVKDLIPTDIVDRYIHNPGNPKFVRDVCLHLPLWTAIEKMFGDKMPLLSYWVIGDKMKLPEPGPYPEWRSIVYIALKNCDSLELFPGSHRHAQDQEKPVPVPLKKGECVVTHVNTLQKYSKPLTKNKLLVALYTAASTKLDDVPIEHLTGGHYYQRAMIESEIQHSDA